ncbi:MAG: PQQ-binding-like beta-propeller repeat protein [Deltaproteobacteria bacterium]|nr:PQQ-binding-like beta-propeller repeat protein [Deltaproteobacteria bacterium]
MKKLVNISFGAACLTSLALVLSACAGAGPDLVVVSGKAFSQETLNDESNAVGQKKVLERLGKRPPAAGSDAVVAITGTAELTGVDLSSGKTWTYQHPLDHRPQITGPVVVGQGGGEVFALDAKTGAPLWKTSKPKGKLIGAGSDGAITAITTHGPEGWFLYAIGKDGSVRFDKSTDMPIARPGVAAGIVFVPWKTIYVTAFEAESGAQLATFITDTETTHVVPMGGALFAGQGRLVRFDQDLLKAKQGGSALAIPPKDLPNVTRRDLIVVPEHDEKVTSDAMDSTPLVGYPNASGAAGFASGKLYGGYYPFVMAFDEKTAKLAWVHTNRDDVIAAAPAKDGVVVVDKAGNVSLISGANGAVTKTMALGKPAMSADAMADTLSIGTGTAPPLPEQIKIAATTKDDRLATAQVYLLEQAAAVPNEEMTAVLLEVADSERAVAAIKDAARKAIALRSNGADAMIKMLARHADFLKGTRTPPVGPMAKALAGMKKKEAAGPLLAQLLDPALPQNDLQDTAEGVGALADKEHLPQLKQFVNMYRGSVSGNMKLSDAIGAISTAIIRLEGDAGKAWVTATAKDALTDADARSTLNKVVEAATPKKKEEPKPEPPKEEPKPKKKKPVDDGPEPPGYKKKKEQEKLDAEKKAKEKAEKEGVKKEDVKKEDAAEAPKPDEKKEAAPPPEETPAPKKKKKKAE